MICTWTIQPRCQMHGMKAFFLGFKQKTHKAFTLKSQVLDVAGCTTKKKEIPQKLLM